MLRQLWCTIFWIGTVLFTNAGVLISGLDLSNRWKEGNLDLMDLLRQLLQLCRSTLHHQLVGCMVVASQTSAFGDKLGWLHTGGLVVMGWWPRVGCFNISRFSSFFFSEMVSDYRILRGDCCDGKQMVDILISNGQLRVWAGVSLFCICRSICCQSGIWFLFSVVYLNFRSDGIFGLFHAVESIWVWNS